MANAAVKAINIVYLKAVWPILKQELQLHSAWAPQYLGSKEGELKGNHGKERSQQIFILWSGLLGWRAGLCREGI